MWVRSLGMQISAKNLSLGVLFVAARPDSYSMSHSTTIGTIRVCQAARKLCPDKPGFVRRSKSAYFLRRQFVTCRQSTPLMSWVLNFAGTQLQGHRVAIIEKNALQGRNQEWNISREELNGLVEMGLVSDAELQAAIVTEFNPVRVAIHGGREVFTTDCLNLGVRPKYAVLHACPCDTSCDCCG